MDEQFSEKVLKILGELKELVRSTDDISDEDDLAMDEKVEELKEALCINPK